MLAIARVAMNGPFAAAASATTFAMLALVFAPILTAPFLVISGGIVCLSGLRHGDAAAAKVAIIAAAVPGIFALIFADGGVLGLALLAALLPLVALASTLRQSQNQGLSLSLAAVFAFGFAIYMRVSIGDVDRYWSEHITRLSELIAQQGGELIPPDKLAPFAAMMHANTILLVMVFMSLSLLLGRWWQAALYNPNGFGQEFRELVLPKAVNLLAAGIAIGYLATMKSDGGMPVITDALVPVMTLFVFQGLAIVHHRAKERNLGNGLFVMGYFFLVFLSHIVGVLLAFIGIVDNVVDFRKLRGRDIEN